MIDIHSHIIYGMGDGPSTKDEAFRMVCEAEEAGVKVIFATPHLREYSSNEQLILERYRELASFASDCGVSLKLGCELPLSPYMLKGTAGLKELTLGGSGFLLLEPSFGISPAYGREVVYKLQQKNLTPIIAHPEQNINFIRDVGALEELIQSGCLVQLDSSSIAGAFGERVKTFSRHLIERNMVNFVASSAHNACGYSDWYLKAYRLVSQWANEEIADWLFCNAACEILEAVKEKNMKLVET